MHKKKIVALSIIIAALVIIVPILASFRSRKAAADDSSMQCIKVWQIDGFEGGRGSRSQYLNMAGEQCFKKEKTYINVVTLSADAARINLENGDMPDIISYAAGFYGIEKIINGKNSAYKNWCRGGYCIISLVEGVDFSDVSAENTVANAGKDNLADVAAAMCGLNGCAFEEPANAYLQLINGKYKYLLGTQRDVFRFKTRNVPFVLQPVTQFNDLYQNVSILTSNAEKYAVCNRFVEFLLRKDDVGSLGLFNGECELCAEELVPMKETGFEYVLNYPCSKEYIKELVAAAKNGDVNKIKTMLK